MALGHRKKYILIYNIYIKTWGVRAKKKMYNLKLKNNKKRQKSKRKHKFADNN